MKQSVTSWKLAQYAVPNPLRPAELLDAASTRFVAITVCTRLGIVIIIVVARLGERKRCAGRERPTQ